MNYDYLSDPTVCPSSLGEDNEPVDINQTAHRWDESTDPHTCAECGTQREEVKCICQCGNEHMAYAD